MVREKIKKGFKKTESLLSNSILKARIGWQGLTVAEYRKHGKFYLVTGTDFKNGKINWNTCVYVDKERFDQDKKIQLKIEDVLVTKDGTIGKIAYVDSLPLPATLNTGVFVIRSKNNSYLPLFLYYILQSNYFKKFLAKLTAGSSIIHLYQKDFVNFSFVVPDYGEQEKIVKSLSDTDELIKQLDYLITKKQNIKQGAMQELLTGKRRVGKFNSTWKSKKIKNIGTVIRGASPRPKGDKRYYGGNVPRLMVKDVTRDGKFVIPKIDYLTKEGEKRSRPCKKGTLTVVCSGTVGIPSFLGIDACIHDGFLAIIDIQKNISEDYLYHQLSNLRNKFEASATHGGIFTNLTTSILKEFQVAFPPTPEEQSVIAQILSDMDSEIQELETKKDKYLMIKESMMQTLLTGEIRLA